MGRIIISAIVFLSIVSCSSLHEAESVEIGNIQPSTPLPFEGKFTIDGSNRNPWILDFYLRGISEEELSKNELKLRVTIYNDGDDRVPYPLLRGHSYEKATPAFLSSSENAEISFELSDYASINLCPGASSIGDCSAVVKAGRLRYKIIVDVEGTGMPPRSELKMNVRDVPITL